MNTINFFESKQTLFLSFLLLFIIASLICSLIMIITLIKKGDERKRFIVKKI